MYGLVKAFAPCLADKRAHRVHGRARRITIDLDPTDDLTRGAQQLTSRQSGEPRDHGVQNGPRLRATLVGTPTPPAAFPGAPVAVATSYRGLLRAAIRGRGAGAVPWAVPPRGAIRTGAGLWWRFEIFCSAPTQTTIYSVTILT